MDEQQIREIILVLEGIREDMTIPKNIKEKIKQTISMLGLNNCDPSIKIDRALEELDGVSDDPNLPMYTRVEVLNVISILGGRL